MRTRTTFLILIVGMLALAPRLGLSRVAAVLAALALMLLGLGARWAFRLRRRRPAGPGFRYVHVEEDGAARELSAEEQAYLEEEFHPADGGRPHVKTWYGSRNPDGRIDGYLRRDRLPPEIRVRPAPVEPAQPRTSLR